MQVLENVCYSTSFNDIEENTFSHIPYSIVFNGVTSQPLIHLLLEPLSNFRTHCFAAVRVNKHLNFNRFDIRYK